MHHLLNLFTYLLAYLFTASSNITALPPDCQCEVVISSSDKADGGTLTHAHHWLTIDLITTSNVIIITHWNMPYNMNILKYKTQK